MSHQRYDDERAKNGPDLVDVLGEDMSASSSLDLGPTRRC